MMCFCSYNLSVQVEAAMGKPPYPGPSDYLILSLVTMIMCGLLNITSLTIGIPGLVFASLVTDYCLICFTRVFIRIMHAWAVTAYIDASHFSYTETECFFVVNIK